MARIIHLTLLTFELGGKSADAVIVDYIADISLAAKRILWGKINNTGQICVAPDYILAQASIIPSLIAALKELFPEGALASSSYIRIILETHFAGLKCVLAKTSGKVVIGDKWENEAGKREFEPTVVTNLTGGDSLLEEEILFFQVYQWRNHPLVLYAFSTNEDNRRRSTMATNTTSGGLLFNDTFQQFSDELPFGGVGESGYVRQVPKYSFDSFVYERSILDIPYHLAVRYPPYTAQSLEFMNAILKQAIPP